MINIKVICVGKLKETYWRDAVKEYSKRLNAYCKLTIEEVPDEKISEKASLPEEEAVKESEGRAILKHVREADHVICLEVSGKEYDSPGLAEKINRLGLQGKSNLVFIIGGSIGIGKNVLAEAHEKISFSKMTFPHQMMRVILLEQLYRAFKIIRNEKYHK